MQSKNEITHSSIHDPSCLSVCLSVFPFSLPLPSLPLSPFILPSPFYPPLSLISSLFPSLPSCSLLPSLSFPYSFLCCIIYYLLSAIAFFSLFSLSPFFFLLFSIILSFIVYFHSFRSIIYPCIHCLFLSFPFPFFYYYFSPFFSFFLLFPLNLFLPFLILLLIFAFHFLKLFPYYSFFPF